MWRRGSLVADKVKGSVGPPIFVTVVELWRIWLESFHYNKGDMIFCFCGLIFSWFHWGAKLFELLLFWAVLSPDDQFSLMEENAYSNTQDSFSSPFSSWLDWEGGNVIWMSYPSDSDNFYLPLGTTALEVAQGTSPAVFLFFLNFNGYQNHLEASAKQKSPSIGIHIFSKYLAWIYFWVLRLYKTLL